MTDLYPTKTRLALLRAARDGSVIHWPDGNGTPWTAWERPGAGALMVTSRVAEQVAADWLEITDEVVRHFGRRVRPTAAGERLLAEHTKEG